MRDTRNSKTAPTFDGSPGVRWLVAWVALLLAAWSVAAIFFFYSRGWLLYYGDAEAHLNIARRIVDSQTPGYDQIGTVWLPLPHILLLPFARVDAWWQSGVAAAIPSAACFVAAGCFLFEAVRRLFDSIACAVVATVLFAANPNIVYLQSTAMTEPVFFATLTGLLYFCVRFRQTQGWGSVVGAGLMACAGTLTRYEGWFLLPFTAIYFLIAARRRRIEAAIVFSVLAGLGPLYWLAHNWWLTGDALAFYRGPYSARAIQGKTSYPGKHDWAKAWLYFRTAAGLCLGPVLLWTSLAGVVAAIAKKAIWLVILLALPAIFYVWSIHSSGTPIFVPTLWPNSYYNTRYGLAALPLLAAASAALVALAPRPLRAAAAVLLICVAMFPWLIDPQPGSWITWQESRVNSDARRQWTLQAADYLRPRYVRGAGILTSFGDLTGIYRQAGIPLRETFTGDNGIPWQATVTRPELFLRQEWAVARRGDAVEQAIRRAERLGIRYTLEKTIVVPGAPVIEIYRR
ncbi:MAG TPA: glycosyltransferase family 39 protein [Bryobacteraceae bacterium]|nr:glycosyltransferase family 39 protein [Bryobacteraceae bacterium]